MPYYQGDYYRGDYYRGDPGLFDILKRVGKTAVGAVKGFAQGGPLGAIGGAGKALISRNVPMPPSVARPAPFEIGIRTPFGTTQTTLGPGGPRMVGPTLPPDYARQIEAERAYRLGARRRGRRIDPLNVKALRRAARRTDMFVRTVRRSLKHTPYMLARKGTGRGRSSRGVITKAEAARALRS